MMRLPSGVKYGAKLAPRERGHLLQVPAVGVHDEDLERRRTPEAFTEQRLVVVELWPGRQRTSAEHDLRAIRREERTAVGPRPVGQAPDVGSVAVHRVDLHVAVADAGEDDAPVTGDRGLGVVPRRGGEAFDAGAVGVRAEDVVAVVDRPDVAAAEVRLRRAALAAEKRGGVEHVLLVGIEERAGRAALAVAEAAHVRAVDAHRVDLVALAAFARRLEDQVLAIEREVGLGVLAAEGQLLHVRQVHFFRAIRARGRRHGRLTGDHRHRQRDEPRGGHCSPHSCHRSTPEPHDVITASTPTTSRGDIRATPS